MRLCLYRRHIYVALTSEINSCCCSRSFRSVAASPIDAAWMTLEQIWSSTTPLQRILINKQMASVDHAWADESLMMIKRTKQDKKKFDEHITCLNIIFRPDIYRCTNACSTMSRWLVSPLGPLLFCHLVSKKTALLGKVNVGAWLGFFCGCSKRILSPYFYVEDDGEACGYCFDRACGRGCVTGCDRDAATSKKSKKTNVTYRASGANFLFACSHQNCDKLWFK